MSPRYHDCAKYKNGIWYINIIKNLYYINIIKNVFNLVL